MYVFAYTVLALFVLIGIPMVTASRPTVFVRRVVMVYLFGILFLPNRLAVDLPVLPALAKPQFAALVPLIAVVLRKMHPLRSAIVFRGPAVLLWIGCVALFGTVATNTDSLHYGSTRLPGLAFYDGVAGVFTELTTAGATFWLARSVIRSYDDLRLALICIAIMGLIHVPLCLIELRLSPQLHRWVYGYTTIGFRNIMRGGGYKPVGFLQGGLAMAIFLYTAVVATAVLASVKARIGRYSARLCLLPLWGVLLVSKNLGANVFAAISLLTLQFGSWRTSLRVIGLVLIAFVAYPVVRGNQMVDMMPLLDWIAEYSPERAGSLWTRIRNEDELIVKALERPLFGWGGYSRARIYDMFGASDSILDGGWIIILGEQGIVGLCATFGLLIVPMLGWRRILDPADPAQQRLIAGTIVILGFSIADRIPNGAFLTLPVFLAGALTGVKDTHKLRAAASPDPSTALVHRGGRAPRVV